ncbi:MAG: hypothetical protein ACK4F7_05990 [Inhella sp.]
MNRLAALLLLVLLSGAARADAPDDGSALLQAVEQAIGTPRCERDAQCRTVALGARACGGPESYRAHSLTGRDAARLEQLAEQHRLTRQALQQRSGRVGICQFLADPGARCVAQRCELLSSP